MKHNSDHEIGLEEVLYPTPGRPGLLAFVQTFGTSVGIQVLTIVTGVVVARMLGPDGRGIFAAAQIWPMIIASIAFLGSNHALSLRAAAHRNEHGALCGAALVLGAALSVTALAAAAFVIPLFLEDPGIRSAALLFLPQIAIFIFVSLLVSVEVGLGRFDRYNMSRWTLGTTNLALALALALVGVHNAHAYLIVLLAANAAALTVLLIRLPWRDVVVWSPHLKALFEGGRFYTATVALIAREQVERLFLLYAVSVEDLGQYVVAFSAAMMPAVLAKSLGLIVFSRSAITGEHGAYEDTGRLFRQLVTLNVAITAASAVVLPVLIPLVYGTQFAPAGRIVLVLVFAQLAIAAFSVLDEGLRGQNRALLGAVAIVLMLVTFFAVAFSLSEKFGAVGVALASVTSHTIALAFLIFAFKRIAPAVPLVPQAADAMALYVIVRSYGVKVPMLRGLLARLP